MGYLLNLKRGDAGCCPVCQPNVCDGCCPDAAELLAVVSGMSVCSPFIAPSPDGVYGLTLTEEGPVRTWEGAIGPFSMQVSCSHGALRVQILGFSNTYFAFQAEHEHGESLETPFANDFSSGDCLTSVGIGLLVMAYGGTVTLSEVEEEEE